jgi:hypothetical protein
LSSPGFTGTTVILTILSTGSYIVAVSKQSWA